MFGTVKKKYINIGEGAPLVWEYLPERTYLSQESDYFTAILNKIENTKLIVNKWYWPKGARSYFTFRADMDGGSKESLLCFLDAIRPWSKSLSLFVCGKAYINNKNILKILSDMDVEVGNHTYTHYVFSSKKKNRINLEITEKILSSAGIKPRGYVGPASFYHSSIYDVLEEKGYDYTSSFGLSHDDYPFFPLRNDTKTYRMVEIPFHCMGDRFPKFDLELDSSVVYTFFEQLLEKKYHRCEPMFIYGHPDMPGRMGDYPSLVKRICEKALSYGDVCTGNMADIAAWWKNRHETRAEIVYDPEKNWIAAKTYSGSADVYWSIQVTESCKYLVSGKELQCGIWLNRLGEYKKINLSSSPFEEIGEVIESIHAKIPFREKISKLRREYRRKKRMIRVLERGFRNNG